MAIKTVWCVKWLFTFIASKLSLTKMVFCVFFKTGEAVKFLLTLIASLFSSLSYIYMNLFVSFETDWGVKWLFAIIAPKLQKYARTTRFWSWWHRDYVRSSDPAYLKHWSTYPFLSRFSPKTHIIIPRSSLMSYFIQFRPNIYLKFSF